MIAKILTFAVGVTVATAGSPSVCISDLTSTTCLTNLATADCEPGQTLFQVIKPSELCPSCETPMVNAMTKAESDGCCTYDTLYSLSSGGCSTGAYYSYTGLADTVQYFCHYEPTDQGDVYCLTDATEYVQSTSDALHAWHADPSSNPFPVNCTYVQQFECCLPSVTAYAAGCGDSTAQAQAANLATWEGVVAPVCASVGVTLDFSSPCAGLPDVSAETCFAANDANCDGISPPTDDDDDAASGLLPLLSTLFAAILAVAFVARRV